MRSNFYKWFGNGVIKTAGPEISWVECIYDGCYGWFCFIVLQKIFIISGGTLVCDKQICIAILNLC